MNEPQIELFDLDGLIKKINSALAESEALIDIGEFESKQPRKNPVLYRITDTELESRGKCLLIQNDYGEGLSGIIKGLIDLPETKIGYVFFERGYVDNKIRTYEIIKLRIKHCLELKNGLIIPNCGVKFLREVQENELSYEKRRDHIRVFGMGWKKTDLSDVLPTEWFLPEYKKHLICG